ncbi:hypothetical protein YIM73518_18240 [Thermus brockianus]
MGKYAIGGAEEAEEGMTLADLVVAYILAIATGLTVLLRPRREPLPEGASVGFVLLVGVLWAVFLLALSLWS